MARMDDGLGTRFILSNIPTIDIRRTGVTPFGTDGGDLKDMTTLENEEWRTFLPKRLKTMTAGKQTVYYDPNDLETIRAQININQPTTLRYPDGEEDSVWATLKSFMPAEHKEGVPPTADMELVPTNMNADLDEAGPEFSGA